MKENEDLLNTKIDTKIEKLKSRLSISINITVSPINPKNSPSYYNQHSDNIIKWPLLKSLDFHSHPSQFTKHLSYMTLEGDNLLQIKNGGCH